MKHEPRTLTDEELRYRIKKGGDVIIDVCTELLARRQADRWIPIATSPVQASEYVVEIMLPNASKIITSRHYSDWAGWEYIVKGEIVLRWRPLPEPPVQP
jgi:hypothetical protein